MTKAPSPKSDAPSEALPLDVAPLVASTGAPSFPTRGASGVEASEVKPLACSEADPQANIHAEAIKDNANATERDDRSMAVDTRGRTFS